MDMFSGKWSAEELQELEDKWYESNGKFKPQDEVKEFGFDSKRGAYGDAVMTYQEISEKLEMDACNVHRTAKRGLAKLKKIFEDSGVTIDCLSENIRPTCFLPRAVRNMIDD